MVANAKEEAASVASKHIADFAMLHLEDYVSKFFKSLLDAENVAPFGEIEAIHTRLKEAKNEHKNLVSKITSSASFANNKEDVMRIDITSLFTSRDEMKD